MYPFFETIECNHCFHHYCVECEYCNCKNGYHLSQSYLPLTIIQIRQAGPDTPQFNLALEGSLIPLIAQEPIKTNYGLKLLSKFIFNDATGKMKIYFWGRLPMKIFNRRYEFNHVKIKGIRRQLFRGKHSLMVQRYADIWTQPKNQSLTQILQG